MVLIARKVVQYREYWFFFSALFLVSFLFSGLLTAFLAILILLVLYQVGSLVVPWIRFPSDVTMALILRTLLGLGILSILWFVAGLLTTGRVRFLLVMFLLFILLGIERMVGKKRMLCMPPPRNPWKKMLLVYGLLPLLLTLFTFMPFRNLGRPTSQGHAYRAYFSTDYLKQYSLIQSLARQRFPPRNPYFADEKLHYYWFPFALPSMIYSLTHDAQNAMKVFSVIVNYLLLAALLLLLMQMFWQRAPSLFFGIFLVFIPVLFLSLEGAYLLVFHLPRMRLAGMFFQVSSFNVDGLTRWLWFTPQIDTLLRTLLYMPQAGLSMGFFISYLLLRKRESVPFGLQVLVLLFSLSANLLIGLAFLVFFGLDFIYSAVGMLKTGQSLGILFRRIFAVLLSLASLVFLFSRLGILAPGNRPISFRFITASQLFPYLILNLGPLLIFGLIGSLLLVKKEPFLFCSIILLVAICSLCIQGFESDIPLKFSLVLQVLLLLAAAEVIVRVRGKSRLWYVLCLILFLLALPTGLIDIANSSDIQNEHFTFYLADDEAKVLRWGAKMLPAGSVVQNFPPARTEGISEIPTFMARATCVGDRLHSRLFLVRESDYQERMDLIRTCFQDVQRHREKLAAMGIEYIFWGKPETEAFGYVPRLKVRFQVNGVFLFQLH